MTKNNEKAIGIIAAMQIEIDGIKAQISDPETVTVSGIDVKLTQTEFNILALLSVHTGKVLTYAAIIQEIWGADVGGSVKKLQVNMANIRKKLGSRPGDNLYIINELGVGYRMGEENL